MGASEIIWQNDSDGDHKDEHEKDTFYAQSWKQFLTNETKEERITILL